MTVSFIFYPLIAEFNNISPSDDRFRYACSGHARWSGNDSEPVPKAFFTTDSIKTRKVSAHQV